jgi:Cu/Zn superoxide dismutase
MTRGITAAAVASIAAMGVASVATADSGRSAKTYKASLAAVNPAATTAGLATVVGKAQLVDGKKNNKVSLHVRNLAATTMYLWHVTRAPACHGRTGRRLDLPQAGLRRERDADV